MKTNEFHVNAAGSGSSWNQPIFRLTNGNVDFANLGLASVLICMSCVRHMNEIRKTTCCLSATAKWHIIDE